MTPEQRADAICRWTNPGLRDAVIKAIHEAEQRAEEAARRLHGLGGMIRGGANYDDMCDRAKADMDWVEKEF